MPSPYLPPISLTPYSTLPHPNAPYLTPLTSHPLISSAPHHFITKPPHPLTSLSPCPLIPSPPHLITTSSQHHLIPYPYLSPLITHACFALVNR